MHSVIAFTIVRLAKKIILGVGRLQKRKVFEPEARRLDLPMPEHPRLNQFIVISNDLFGITVRNGVFDANSANWCGFQGIEELSSSGHPMPASFAVDFCFHTISGLDGIVKMPNAGVGQIGARRVRHHQIPALIEDRQHITLNVVTGAFSWQKVAGPSIVATRLERIPHNSAELAGNQNSHDGSLATVRRKTSGKATDGR